MVIEIFMPALSPTMTTGNLTKWYKNIGDSVKAGEVLIEIETDKSAMEYEAVDEGVLAKIFIPAGTEGVKINEIICILAVGNETVESLKNYIPKTKDKKTETTDKPLPTLEMPNTEYTKLSENNSPEENVISLDIKRLKVSPVARQTAEEHKIDLTKILGSGPEGRIVKSDILGAITSKSDKKDYTKQVVTTDKTNFGRTENSKVQLSGMRKVIAERLLYSKTTIPHFYLNNQCVIDDLLSIRKKINEKLGLKITINDLIVKAVASALSKFPEVNRCWGGDHIVQCGNIDIAVAVDIEDGLITPIVENANRLSISKLSEKLKDLISRARENKLKASEYQGGSITISNLGMFGIKSFSAIVNPPHASILSVGGVSRQPTVGENDELKIKSVMELGISADHRVIDGALAAKFLTELKKLLEDPILFMA